MILVLDVALEPRLLDIFSIHTGSAVAVVVVVMMLLLLPLLPVITSSRQRIVSFCVTAVDPLSSLSPSSLRHSLFYFPVESFL